MFQTSFSPSPCFERPVLNVARSENASQRRVRNVALHNQNIELHHRNDYNAESGPLKTSQRIWATKCHASVSIWAQAHASQLFIWRSAASAKRGCNMVNRSDKRAKFTRWCIYFPKHQLVRTWKRTLSEVVGAGLAKVCFNDVLPHRVELVWIRAVTYDSVARLRRLAREQDTSFEILG